MNILTEAYFAEFEKGLPIDIGSSLNDISATAFTPENFIFYTSVAVMASSRIEGEQMEIDSYVKHKLYEVEYLPELTQKPDDLYRAYLFARQHDLTDLHFRDSHKMITDHLLPVQWRGTYRKNEMLVLEHGTGRVQYEAAASRIVGEEMAKLWEDINYLLRIKLTTEEIFYFAAFIHLVFVSIHPFNDGNGRAGRLLEKWFLASHLGEKAWYIKSEQYFYIHADEYYRNLSLPGMFYDRLKYERSLPFLWMLPQSLRIN